jgi:hypothetical protein
LLQAHEDGRVVFFCGAGISYPAGLPGFSDLVKKLYEAIGESPNALESFAIKSGQFDSCIGLLESRIAGVNGCLKARKYGAGLTYRATTSPAHKTSLFLKIKMGRYQG